jgi:hypothetical protein
MRVPARKIKKSAVKNIVRFAPIKSNNGKSILVESILEAKYCLHMEFDPNVISYFPQPKTFNLGDDEPRVSYTPDFEVNMVDGNLMFVEVKPEYRARSDYYQEVFSHFKSYLDGTNAKFLLVSESNIDAQPLLSNYQKLYRFRKRPEISTEQLYHFASANNSPFILKDLLKTIKNEVSIRQVYSWIANDFLKFDIHSTELSIESEVWFDV